MVQEKPNSLFGKIVLPLFLFIVTTVYLVAAFQIKPQVDEGVVGPKFIPILASIFMYIVLGLIVRRTVREANQEDSTGDGLAKTDWKGLGLIVLSIALYISLFKVLGYLLGTFLFVYCLLYVFGLEGCGQIKRVLYSVAITAVFYILFVFIFQVRLPVLEVLS